MTNKYVFTFIEEVTSQIEIEAQTEEEARKIVEEGNFEDEEILDRNHMEILDRENIISYLNGTICSLNR